MPEAPNAPVEPDVPVKSMSAAISNAIVGLMHQYTGRGPTRVRTTLSPDMVVVTLRDSLTKAERTLVERGSPTDVLTLRRAFKDTMRAELIDAVELLTGRTVEAFLGDTLPNPDVAVQIYLLDRSEQNGDHGN